MTQALSRILVVDDEPASRLLLARSLQKAGYQVLTANDSLDGVTIAAEHRPDLILLDVIMPERNGLATCEALKSRTETTAIPVIFVTAASEADEIVDGFAVGGCDYVTKPVRIDELLARVSVHLRLRRAEERLQSKHEQLEKLARQLAETNTELAMLSRLDPLTRLLNRAAWAEVAAREHEQFEQTGRPYGLVMVDIDHFKAFNDSCGHQKGDECLRRVAESIASACAPHAIAGRYGGEEFVILSPNSERAAAVELAERVRKAVWSLAIEHPSSNVAKRVTVSLGVATSVGDSWEHVVNGADRALYVAKKAGRNMVSCDTVPQEEKEAPTTKTWHPQHEPACSTGTSGELEGQPYTVLVVDDDPTNRALCKGCLQRAGYRIREAEDGRSALTSVAEARPDVIIMDVMMPEMDGLECTRKLKDDPATRDIPVVIASALSDGDDVVAGLEAGADEYLTKPIRTAELGVRIRSIARLCRERVDLLRSYEVRGEHVRMLISLVDFCRAVGTSVAVEEVLEHAVAAVAESVQARRVSAMLPDQQRRVLRIVKSIGMDPELAASVEVPVGGRVAGEVFASGERVVVNSDAGGWTDPDDYDSSFFVSTPLISSPMGTSGRVVGVLNVTERVGRRPFLPHELEHIELISRVAATAIEEITARQAHARVCDLIVVALAQLAEHRDDDTGKHLERVTRFCCILAERLRKKEEFATQIDEDFLTDLTRAMPLHDIGKVAIPDSILLHPGKLTEEQMSIMRTHTVVGASTIQSVLEHGAGVNFLAMAQDIAHYHHERFDGSGYPEGLKGAEIPLAARIAAIADVYDALTTKRVYKDAYSHDRAVAIIVEGSGAHFDPAVVDAFIECDKEFADLAKNLADDVPAASVRAKQARSSAVAQQMTTRN